MSRRLLIDAGNSRLKWAVVDGGTWQAQGSSQYDDLAALAAQLTPGSEVFVASVASTAREQQLGAVLAAASLRPAWLAAEARFGDVVNCYADPSQLGVDRWMGLIAARQRSQEPVLVVSVGTAMTVDALAADGVFLGGVIVPGVRLMREALATHTARVADIVGHQRAFPRSTADAMQSGIVAALCGAIRQQFALLSGTCDSLPRCLLSGGDADLVLPHLGLPAEQVPALVLEGIDCVARAKAST